MIRWRLFCENSVILKNFPIFEVLLKWLSKLHQQLWHCPAWTNRMLVAYEFKWKNLCLPIWSFFKNSVTMTNECCIPNCKNTQKTEKYTLFWAPKDNHQRKKWENIIPRKGPLRQTHRVCALHFQEQDVIKGKTVVINGKKDFYQYHPMQWKLRPGALPRIFPGIIISANWKW